MEGAVVATPLNSFVSTSSSFILAPSLGFFSLFWLKSIENAFGYKAKLGAVVGCCNYFSGTMGGGGWLSMEELEAIYFGFTI